VLQHGRALHGHVGLLDRQQHVRNAGDVWHDGSLLLAHVAPQRPPLQLSPAQHGDVGEFADECERRIFAVTEQKSSVSFVHVKPIIAQAFKTIESLYERQEEITGVPTGFLDLDWLTSGFQPGYLGILAGHAPLVTELAAGEISYRKPGETNPTRLAVAWGFAEVLPDKTTLLAEIAERPEEIDVEAAKKLRAQALERLRNASEVEDVHRFTREYEAAQTRIEVAARAGLADMAMGRPKAWAQSTRCPNPAATAKVAAATNASVDADVTSGTSNSAGNLTVKAISGNSASRVFDVNSGATVTIAGLRIANGATVGGLGGGLRAQRNSGNTSRPRRIV